MLLTFAVIAIRVLFTRFMNYEYEVNMYVRDNSKRIGSKLDIGNSWEKTFIHSSQLECSGQEYPQSTLEGSKSKI